MKTIKTNHLGEIELFSSLRVFTDFQKKYNMGIEAYVQKNPMDFEAYGFALYSAYKSALKINGVEVSKYTLDDFIDRLSIDELVNALPYVMGSKDEKAEVPNEVKKK